MILKQYIKVNSQFKKELVYHLGYDSGFFSEYNNMLFAMVYCLNNKIKFSLYSADANFGLNNGWSDYFIPFIKEKRSPFHHKYNFRYRVSYNYYRNRKVDCKIRLYKLLHRNTYLTYEMFDPIRDYVKQGSAISIPLIGYSGSLRNLCHELVNITWKYNDTTKNKIEDLIAQLDIPDSYIGIHIRSGDKRTETVLLDVKNYINEGLKKTEIRTAFVSTDDYTNIQLLKETFPEWKFYYLCNETHLGYYQSDFQKMSKVQKNAEMIELFASLEILSNSQLFIGTFSSNIGLYLGMRMNPEKCIGIDTNDWFVW